MTEKQKEKYRAFITEVSEILGLGKPVDIIKLCMVTDNLLKPLQKQVVELEKEKCELLGIIQGKDNAIKDLEWQLQEVAKDNDNYQKENKELEAQIDKMKNRCNCKNGWYSIVGKAGFGCNLNIEKCEGCIKWELAE